MIVCLCNALREREIERGLAQGVETVDEVFSTFGCEARCRSCVPEIAAMIVREQKRAQPTKADPCKPRPQSSTSSTGCSSTS